MYRAFSYYGCDKLLVIDAKSFPTETYRYKNQVDHTDGCSKQERPAKPSPDAIYPQHCKR